MPVSTLFVGKHLIVLDKVDSTNSYAMELLKEKKVHDGSVVWAKIQETGRGQAGNKWFSGTGGNLTFSMVLAPGFLSPSRQFQLSKVVALALFNTLTEWMPDRQNGIAIKWPNDILLDGKKIAGVLIENSISADKILSSIIGVGLNVNQQVFPNELKQATSMLLASGKEFPLEEILNSFCSHFEALYLELKSGKDKLIDEYYLKHLYRRERVSQFRSRTIVFEAEIAGVDFNGKLILRMGSGAEAAFGIKEVEFID